MMKPLTVLALAGAAILAMGSSGAMGVPQGSYLQSCTQAYVDGDTLRARCWSAAGRYKKTWLTGYAACVTDIANVDGVLTCSGHALGNAPAPEPVTTAEAPPAAEPPKPAPAPKPAPQPQPAAARLPAGSYASSCVDIRVDGDTLRARCPTRSGRMKTTFLGGYVYCDGDIANVDGLLSCVGGRVVAEAPPPAEPPGPAPRPAPEPRPEAQPVAVRLPPGSYATSCVDVRIDGDTLRARCPTRSGRMKTTWLTGYAYCDGDIANVDGRLSCVGGRVVAEAPPAPEPPRPAPRPAPQPQPAPQPVAVRLPAGSYAASCTDIEIDGDTLRARCPTRSGRMKTTFLTGYVYCDGDIANVDGLLSCVGGRVVADAPPPAEPPRPVPQPQPQPAPQPVAVRLPPGSYAASCTDIEIDGDTLRARCPTRSGRMKTTFLGGYVYCDGDIANVDGLLSCVGGRVVADAPPPPAPPARPAPPPAPRPAAPPPAPRPTPVAADPWPPGTWRSSCRDVRIVGAALTAECRENSGGWRFAWADLEVCRGPIANDDGRLVCR